MSEEKTVSIYAKHLFSKDELVKIATDLAIKCNEKDTIEDEKKSVTASLTSKLALVQSQINLLANNYRQGYEYRNIECEMQLNIERKMREYISVANGEIIKEEPMLPEDFQIDAFVEKCTT